MDLAHDWWNGAQDDSTPPEVARSFQHRYLLWAPATAVLVSTLEDGGEWILVQAVAPLDRTGESCRQFNTNGIDPRAKETGVRVETLVEWEVKIQREDREIMEIVYPKDAPLDPQAQAHTRADRYSLMYRRIYQELVAAARPSLSDQDTSSVAGNS